MRHSENTSIFSFQAAHQVRVIEKEPGEYWFIAQDVCNALSIKDTWGAIRPLDNDEKGTDTISTPGGKQKVTIISESGLYKIILRSRKPAAKKFTNWVTKEVLPSIRRKGSYTTSPQPEPTSFKAICKSLIDEWVIDYCFKGMGCGFYELCEKQAMVQMCFALQRRTEKEALLLKHCSDFSRFYESMSDTVNDCKRKYPLTIN